MKTRSILYKTLIAAMLCGISSCSDDLEIEPNDQIAKENFFKSEEDFKAATAPLYNRVWFSFNDKFYFGLYILRVGNAQDP